MNWLRNYFTKLGGYSLSQATSLWMGTLDFQAVFYDRTVDTTFTGHEGPVIMLFWHEYILFPFYLRRHNDVAILLSQHRDADWLMEAARYRGFLTVRGSSTRGGVQALRELMQHCRRRSLAITPDGPRGPRRKMSQGPIYLSSKLQIPLVCCGMGYSHTWRLNTWDQFALPVPCAAARGVVGPRWQIPPQLDSEGLEHYRVQVEQSLNEMTTLAEEWAVSGKRYRDSHRPRPEPRPFFYDAERRPNGTSQHELTLETAEPPADAEGPPQLRIFRAA